MQTVGSVTHFSVRNISSSRSSSIRISQGASSVAMSRSTVQESPIKKYTLLSFMVALWNRADHIYFHAVVYSFFFFLLA